MIVSRQVAAAARRFADQQSARQADRPTGEFYATVTAVTTGGAADGNALVKVRWRGQEITAAGYLAHYTPAVGHRVKCSMVDQQPIVEGRVIGVP